MASNFLTLVINGLLFVGYHSEIIQWPQKYNGKVDAKGTYTFEEEKSFTLDYDGQKGSIFRMVSHCQGSNDDEHEYYMTVLLYNTGTSEVILSDEVKCSDDLTSAKYSNPREFDGTFNVRVVGTPTYNFDIEVYSEMTAIEINEKGFGESLVRIDSNSHIVKSFTVSDEQITATGTWSYIQISVESNDTFMNDPEKNVMMEKSWKHGCGPGGSDGDERIVAKLLVTQNHEDLDNFISNPDAVISESMRLSFSCFGMITISNASMPVLQSGHWVIGVTLDPKQNHTRSKNVIIRVTIETDYQFAGRIGVMLAISLIGIIIPFMARFIFDAENKNIFNKVTFKTWLMTVKDWCWRGNKGMTYLVALIAALLVVSAFQVVNARHYEMTRTGNRDLCYYNEKCYRPYGHYYDAPVNHLASNLPFMVLGLILVLYYSIAESYCRANDHKYYDYSFPYSFGFAFICEGFGSLIYHICPSQIIFQFDTLFMFVISLLMSSAIYDGLAIRDHDEKYSRVARQKTIRPTKLFAFFVGPVYFFNFIGNLNQTKGLPDKFMAVFYVLFGLWWVGILSWLAYKMGLFSKCCDPKDLPKIDEEVDVDGVKRSDALEWVIKHVTPIWAVSFAIYCVIVLVGFVFAVLQKVAFSMFILGVLIIALIVSTVANFLPVAGLVVGYFHNLRIQLLKNCCTVSKYCLVLFGMMAFLLIGCAVIALSLVFFKVYTTTDKSSPPWISRESNNPCYHNDFYDTHDFWHLLAGFGLMIMSMVVTQISKPCRDCYLHYMANTKKNISTVKATFGPTGDTAESSSHAVTDI